MKKLAKIFLTALYLHLVLSIAVFVFLLGAKGWNQATGGFFMFYLAMAAITHLTGWGCAAAAAAAYHKKKADTLRQSWMILKLWSIPFYVLNFLYSALVWFLLIGASRGLMGLLVPIPVVFTCLFVIQSGCVGICYLMLLRKKYQKSPSGIHYVLQLISVLDIFSTIWVLKNYPHNPLCENDSETKTQEGMKYGKKTKNAP